MTTMIALIGEQPLPNFLPIRYYRPDDVLLVYTGRTRQKCEFLQATIQDEVRVSGLEVDPYDISAVAAALDKEINRLAPESLLFNLTGGTKTMSLGAYQVAEHLAAPMIYLQSEGKNTRICQYQWDHSQLLATKKELLPECITLHDIFDLHLGPGNWLEKGSSRDEGSPFEETLAATLREPGYEVMLGVKALSGQLDIDVAVRAGNQYGILEAKMGKNGRKIDGIKQLNNAVRHLGTYSQTFYVIAAPPQSAHTLLTDASNIQVISLPSYDPATHVLSPLDKAELLERVGNALKS
jgi:hypothetical protein